MSETCETCRHWFAEPEAEMGDCLRARPGNGETKALALFDHGGEDGMLPALLFTRADFGCNQYESKA